VLRFSFQVLSLAVHAPVTRKLIDNFVRFRAPLQWVQEFSEYHAFGAGGNGFSYRCNFRSRGDGGSISP
jgi:hypothetical protein